MKWNETNCWTNQTIKLVYDETTSMAGKIVAITGGNTGLGKETAVKLAALGADVIILCRNPSRADAAIAEIKERSGWECMNVHGVFDVNVLLLHLLSITWSTSIFIFISMTNNHRSLWLVISTRVAFPFRITTMNILMSSYQNHHYHHPAYSQARSKLVTALPLDLSDLENVAKCTDKLKAYLGSSKLDVLVNNAGIMALPTREVCQSFITHIYVL